MSAMEEAALRAQNEMNMKIIEDLRARLDVFEAAHRQPVPPPQPHVPQVGIPMVERYRATEESFRPAITLPPLAAQDFKLKTSLIEMVQRDCIFSGTALERPQAHLACLTQICQTFHTSEVPNDTIKLMMFPFSLVGAAKEWLNELPADSIHTWGELVTEFLRKYYPPSKVAEDMAEITNFTHSYGEELGDAWRRFSQLLRRCPTHGEPWHKLMHYFYNALDWETAEELDRLAGGSFMVLDYQRAQQILNTVANRETTRSDMGRPKKSRTDPGVQSQLDYLNEVVALLLKAQTLQTQRVQPPPQPSYVEIIVPAMAKLTDKLDSVVTEMNAMKATVAEQGKKIEASTHEISMHANLLAPTAQAHAVITRSGLATTDPPYPSHARAEATKATEKELEELIPVPTVVPSPKDTSGRSEEKKKAEDDILKNVPFPQRLKKVDDEKQFKQFVEMFKKLHINIPFAEAISQMPKYAKFLKDILSNKRRIEEVHIVTVNEECSAIIQKALPPKMKDPGGFIIPVTLGNAYHGKALCDLGASINVMPTSTFKKLGLGEPTPTILRLQMADRTIKRARGILEDVLVRAGDLIFPADFVIMDMEADAGAPLILGRPFLATGKANIDVIKGELTMRVEDEKVTFNVFEPIESTPCATEHCYRVDEYPFDEEEDERMMQEIRDEEEEEMLQWTLLGLEEDMKNHPEWYAISGRSKLPSEKQKGRTRKKRKNWEPIAWHPKGKEKRPLDPDEWNKAEVGWEKNKCALKAINLADKFFPPWFDVH